MQIEYWFALRCSMRALGRGLAPKLRACARIGAGGARGKFTHKRAYFPVWNSFILPEQIVLQLTLFHLLRVGVALMAQQRPIHAALPNQLGG